MKRFLICLLLAGCAQEPVVQTVEVKVPIPTKMVPPPELATCGQEPPTFRFYAPSPDSKDLVIREADQPLFQKWIESKSKCITAWQEWAE